MLAFEGGRAALEDAADACGLSVASLTEHVDRGRAPRAGAARTWVLDPVDGTKGFLRGAQFCCALALVDGVPGERDARRPRLPEPRATCELPAGDPMDAAGVVVAAARAAAPTSRRSPTDHDASARAAADLGISRPPLRLDSQAKAALLANGQAELFTRLPTAGYVEKVWDFAAAKVVITEAGGAISDLDGDDIDVDLGECLSPKVAGIVHTAFDIKTTSDWAEATDLRTRDELQAELSRLRSLALMCVNAKMDNKRIEDKLDRCRGEETDELVGQFEQVSYGASKQIITQGETGDTFYVIESGICDAFIKGTSKAVASPARGMGFGELALMYNTPRAASITARTDVVLWKIERQEYRLVLASHAQKRSKEYKELLSEVVLQNEGKTKKKLLKDCITDSQMTKLADAMDEDNVAAGHNIICEGDEGHTFFIIADGEVVVRAGQG
ncbi:3'(2'),5'-bisphosphate nucleotidase [Aureococcus anophagefferens]|nr:3'(2'),5'-bisphosphate nucleotidase [Aureococcus anophagefferens]